MLIKGRNIQKHRVKQRLGNISVHGEDFPVPVIGFLQNKIFSPHMQIPDISNAYRYFLERPSAPVRIFTTARELVCVRKNGYFS